MIDIKRNTVADIRSAFVAKYKAKDFADNGTLEITGANFIADEDCIFGKVNTTYVKKELAWYLSRELNIEGLGPAIPQVWRDIAGSSGQINSNYGWCIFSAENNYQFVNAIKSLTDDKASRQAVMIYTRPNMHTASKANGMRDFICTNTVQLLIRENKLEYHVYMRSNDVVFGYNNDFAWHRWVYFNALGMLCETYPNLNATNILWNAGSLHVYPRHFNLVGESS